MRYLGYIFTCCLIITSIFSCGGTIKMDSSDMLKLSGRKHLPTQADFPDDGALVLYEEDVNELYLDSNWEVNVKKDYHIAILYLNDKAEEQWATQKIYLTDQSTLLDFSARTIKANGDIIELTNEDLHPTLLTDGAENISRERSVKFTFPGVEPGVILETSYTVIDERFFGGDIWQVQKSIPVLYTKYSVELPTIFSKHDYNWTYSGNKIDVGEPEMMKNVMKEKSVKNRSRIFYWELLDIPPFKYEPQSPPYFDIAKYVNIDLKYKDWNERSEVYWKHIKNQFDDAEDPEIIKLAQKIIGDAKDEKTKIDRIFTYTQKEYRYLAMNIGESGIIPNYCRDIIKNQYGDCKDMTVMNVNLLRALGIEAYPALVATKSHGYVPENLISLLFFDHMIVYVKTQDGETFWLDATGSNCPLGQVYSGIEGKKALVIDRDGKSKFIKILESRDVDNRITRHIKMNISKEGKLTGHATVVFTGSRNLEMRSRFRAASKNDMTEYWERVINANTPDISLSNLNYDDPKEIEKEFKVEFDFNKEGFGAMTNSLLIFKPVVFDLDTDLEIFIDEKRQHPLVFLGPFKIEDEVIISFDPKDFDIEGLGNSGSATFIFASFRCNSKIIQEGEISYKRDYSIRRSRIMPGNYQNFRTIEKAVAAANEENIVLKLK